MLNNLKIHFMFCAETRCFSAAYFSRLILFGEMKAVYFYNQRHKQVNYKQVGRDSVVGVATCYRLDIPGIESRWEGGGGGREYPHPCSLAPGPTQRPIQWIKRLRRGVHNPPHLTSRFKEE